MTYTVTVHNTGLIDCTDANPASFTDDLADVLNNAAYNNDATGGATVSGTTLTWSGPPAAGASVTVTVSYGVTVHEDAADGARLQNLARHFDGPVRRSPPADGQCNVTVPIMSLPLPLPEVKAELDRLTAEFFDAFDNRDGRPADVARLRRLMLPGSVITVAEPKYLTYSLEEFIGPREQLLSDGRLTEFHEWETSEHTDVAGSVACRIGGYRKSGLLNGEPYEGGGTKTFQFVRTPDGWRISAFSWHDES
ncbi:DUF7927 domain-containing protein [Kitasatospora griseola]|uniref:DUF7927 domain-containing protein n=1 Tax=Kitasatospora griseola TaxID=2064 RepID=UPI003669714B